AGGGFQVAGFGGESQIMNVLEPGRGWRNATFHAGTYNGHPIGVAAGLKAVQILGEHPEFYDQVNRLGRQLFSGLQELADDRRNREKAPSVQLQAASEQASLYGETPPPSV